MDHHLVDRNFGKITEFFKYEGDVLRLPYPHVDISHETI